MSASNSDLVSVITKDHREVEEAFKELESGQGSADHRRDLADHVIAELVRHSVAEEQYMYPAAREVSPTATSSLTTSLRSTPKPRRYSSSSTASMPTTRSSTSSCGR
jgi:hemerythrin superfamily protein